jgi:hypothetical protein
MALLALGAGISAKNERKAMRRRVCVGQEDALRRPTPLEKNASVKRPGPLEELQEAPSQPDVPVHARFAPPEAARL